MDENIKDIIKIPDALDNVVLKGFEEGKNKRKREKNKKIFKRTSVAAAVVLIGVTVVGVINPEIVSAIPIVNRAFDYFSNSNYKTSIEKYKEVGEVINKTIEKDGAKVTLEEFVLDDNILVATFIVESESLKGYEEVRSPADFFNLDLRILINGESPKSWGPRTTIISDTKGAVILTADISEMKLEGDIKVDLNVRGITRGKKTLAKGPWDYNILTANSIESEKYSGDKAVKVEGGEVWVDSLIKTAISSRVIIKGQTASGNNDGRELGYLNYKIRDNNGIWLLTENASGQISPKGEYEQQIDILSDLTNVEYVELLQVEEGETIRRDIIGGHEMPVTLLNSASKSQDESNKKEEFISRKPTKEELSDGYGLSSVEYLLNIDKEKDFMTINELIGTDIKVNSTDTVTIIGIEANEKETIINMKINGEYNYGNLSGLVIFDEDMNDTSIWEGHTGPVIENIEKNEVSMTLGPIDKSKKYTIAIPMARDLKVDEASKITIKLK